jgi:hypothetical protein
VHLLSRRLVQLCQLVLAPQAPTISRHPPSQGRQHCGREAARLGAPTSTQLQASTGITNSNHSALTTTRDTQDKELRAIATEAIGIRNTHTAPKLQTHLSHGSPPASLGPCMSPFRVAAQQRCITCNRIANLSMMDCSPGMTSTAPTITPTCNRAAPRRRHKRPS